MNINHEYIISPTSYRVIRRINNVLLVKPRQDLHDGDGLFDIGRPLSQPQTQSSNTARARGAANDTFGLDRLTYDVRCGDAGAVVGSIQVPVNCVVTSPPYFRKRLYGDSGEELGHEKSVEAYIQNLVSIFNAVPLHQTGSIWVNLGDSRDRGRLLMVPERFAFEMIRQGWLLLDRVIWAKRVVRDDGTTIGNCMPDPPRHRLSGSSHEFLFRFAKRHDAWTDICAVSIPRLKGDVRQVRYLPPELMHTITSVEGRGLSDVWQVSNAGQSAYDHYAVYPPTLVERPIAMTCPMFVDQNGNPRSRIIEMVKYDDGHGKCTIGKGKYIGNLTPEELLLKSGRRDTNRPYIPRKPVTKGWTDLDDSWRPGLVLDPFAGTGTTCEVALKMGRSVIAVELYEKNCALIKNRCQETLDRMRAQGLNPFRQFN